MPAPTVYVIAVVGTVGVVIAFKEHLALTDRRQGFKLPGRGEPRQRGLLSLMLPSLNMVLIKTRSPIYSDHSDLGLGNASSSSRQPAHPYLKNGLLIRRRSGSSETTLSNPGDVELNWITSTSTATETGPQQQDLRLRKNNRSLNESSHDFKLNKTTETLTLLDQSIQAIPYTPLSPVRTPTPTHVLYNSSSMHSPLDSLFNKGFFSFT